jgi:hypothetical protein
LGGISNVIAMSEDKDDFNTLEIDACEEKKVFLLQWLIKWNAVPVSFKYVLLTWAKHDSLTKCSGPDL